MNEQYVSGHVVKEKENFSRRIESLNIAKTAK